MALYVPLEELLLSILLVVRFMAMAPFKALRLCPMQQLTLATLLMTVGQMSFMGNYTQEANGSLTFDIAGAAPGQYDQLNVSGHATLNGLMTVDLLQASCRRSAICSTS